jgi:hypothetical protein
LKAATASSRVETLLAARAFVEHFAKDLKTNP